MQCPKYGFEITDTLKRSYCLNCRDKCEGVSHSMGLGKVDIFELGRLLKEKRDKEKDMESKG